MNNVVVIMLCWDQHFHWPSCVESDVVIFDGVFRVVLPLMVLYCEQCCYCWRCKESTVVIGDGVLWVMLFWLIVCWEQYCHCWSCVESDVVMINGVFKVMLTSVECIVNNVGIDGGGCQSWWCIVNNIIVNGVLRVMLSFMMLWAM